MTRGGAGGPGDGTRMSRPHALDLFCGAGGASVGLHRAGFDVTGVDVVFQPRYPFRFIQADALEYPLEGYDLIWASPPCQHYSIGTNNTWHRRKKASYPDLIGPVRDRLKATGVPYIIENVIGAPLNTHIMLCGRMFGLPLFRHRLFESSLFLLCLMHPKHHETIDRDGIVPVYNGKWKTNNSTIAVPGELGRKDAWVRAMGIDWMTKQELSQAIPPAYSEFLARQIAPDLPARSTIIPSRQGGG